MLTACSGHSSSQSAGDPCSRLDLSLLGQATVKAYSEAAATLRSKFDEIESRVFSACDGMNTTLALARPNNTYGACGSFRARVNEARDAGAEIALQVSASCTVDGVARARCEDKCQLESCTSAECPDSAPCRDACGAVAEAGVECTADTVALTSVVDAELAAAISQNASEWGTLDSLVAELEPTVTEIGPPLLAYAQTADVIGKDEQDCYQDALGNLGVALISFDASRDGLASLPSVLTEPTN
ncbi:MAG TPA: hypothetical protein VGL19_21185 [Polyangiaceae bacterium]